LNWLTNLPPGLKSIFAKKDESEGDSLWVKCPKTGELVYRQELESAYWVTPSGAHMRVSPEQRFKYMFDGGLWTEIPMPPVMRDPLKFKDDKRYTDRLKAAKAKTGREDCMVAAHGEINGRKSVILVQDFAFMGGSLGMAAGEAFIKAAEAAVARKAAFIVVTASGGARMQESSFALMQMPRTVLAVQDVKRAKLPYIVVLSDPDVWRRAGVLRHAGRRADRRAAGRSWPSPARASSRRRSARNCRKASSVRNSCASVGWSTSSATARN
jgi:acetyl-CoA carboxylase carboxyl transferase subunit beta